MIIFDLKNNDVITIMFCNSITLNLCNYLVIYCKTYVLIIIYLPQYF
jgi:hypothetical protein